MQSLKSSKDRTRHHIPKKVWIPSSILLLLIIVPVLFLSWLGLVPGLSNLMSSNNQRNLGVRFTQQSLTSFEQQTPLTFKNDALAPVNPADTSEKQVLAQPVNVQDVTLGQDEVTALLNSNHWSWMPIDNIQVRFGNGTVELSGLVRTDHLNAFENYIANGKPLNSNVTRLINWSEHFRNNAPIYIKLQTFSVDNFVSYKLEQVQVGRFTIPIRWISSSLGQVNGADIKTTDLQIQRAYLTEGELHFSGTYPSVVYVKN
ncbi:MAG TPA: hypothetical protein VMB52_02610 [Verrucomicrobiae bacterium]|nr:hypothetical protein [Verrucomicrobiae bacterium]